MLPCPQVSPNCPIWHTRMSALSESHHCKVSLASALSTISIDCIYGHAVRIGFNNHTRYQLRSSKLFHTLTGFCRRWIFTRFPVIVHTRRLDLEGDLMGVPHTRYLSGQSFIAPLKLVWREQDIVAMNDWKKQCVGLQWTWVSKRTVP